MGTDLDPVAAYAGAEPVRLSALFEAERWLVVSSDSQARGLADDVLGDVSESRIARYELRDPTIHAALRSLSPREPVLIAIKEPVAWVVLAKVFRTLAPHHGSVVVVIPQGGDPSPWRSIGVGRGTQVLEVRTAAGAAQAIVIRHARSVLAGTTRRPDARVELLDSDNERRADSSVRPLPLPVRHRDLDEVVDGDPRVWREPSDPVPVVHLELRDLAPVEGDRRILDLLLLGVVPILHGARRFSTDAGSVLDRVKDIDARALDRRALLRHAISLRRQALIEHTQIGRRAEAIPVSILLVTKRPSFLAEAVRQMVAQRHPSVELVIIGHGFDPDPLVAPFRNRTAIEMSTGSVPTDRTLGDGLNLAVELARGSRVLKIDDDDWYGPEIVGDLVRTMELVRAELVGSAMDFIYLGSLDLTVQRGAPAERFGEHVSGATMLIRRDDLRELGGWARVPRAVDSRLLDRLRVAGGAHYAMHGYGYVVNRHGSGNTFAVEDAWFLDGVQAQWSGLDLEAAGASGGGDA